MRISICILACLFLSACGSNKLEIPDQSLNTYKQDFYSKETFLVRERNGTPHIVASGFLIDRNRGIFATAKHFVEGESDDGNNKIFFNGRIYDGFILRVPITDIGVIKIGNKFDSSIFPEAYRIAHDINVGDKVFVRGIHPHPLEFLQDRMVVHILEQYYGLIEKKGLVYESLEARVVSLHNIIRNKELEDDNSEEAEKITSDALNEYINLKMAQDHLFTFGGLSGGPAVNEKGEVIGITSNQLPMNRIPPGVPELTKRGFKTQPFDEINVIPASELEKLMLQLMDIK